MVLDNIEELETLKNIVRASPDYHAAYLSAREVILNRLIFYGDLFHHDDEGGLTKMEALIEVKHKVLGRRISDEVKTLLRQIRGHVLGLERLRTLNGEIVLNYEQCLSMLTVHRITWREHTVTYTKLTRRGTTKLRYPNYRGGMQTFRGQRPRILGFDRNWPEERKTDLIYLDDVRDGYERLDVKLYRWHRHLSVFCPETNKWRDWIASEDHAGCGYGLQCDCS